ncbi:hypothetical protein IWX49DRAFT_344660 [Phyllosticta citricarpa]
MRIPVLAIALSTWFWLSAASPLTQAGPRKCNKQYDKAACGACHYWKDCLAPNGAWYYPCAACDFTSWCNCTAPAGLLGPEPGEAIITTTTSSALTKPTPRNSTAIFKHVLPN